MSWWFPLCLLVIWTLEATASHERTVHRLIGGHIKIHHEDPNDAELLTLEASGSKGKKSQKIDDEEKKTLSQQVADGKYGLIQKEIFAKPIKRPGVLSYENNPEVPKDNINNLGGLTKNDIWLAENHLLVLRGGTYPPHDNHDNSAAPWPAIDDYKAPLRQVKIPAHPKVPPPFPVQLKEGGPLQILGTNSSRTINGSLGQTDYAVPAPIGFEKGGVFTPFDPYSTNSTSGEAPFPIPPGPPGEYQPGAPFPPYPLNGTLPPYFASLPPGAAILPPPNLNEPFDEDDPSIYYPPPYSFYYPKDNSSAVPAGPLVPGIVLPPPPNFFAPLEESPKKTTTRVKTTTTSPRQIRPTTPKLPPTSVKLLPIQPPSEINNELKPIVTTVKPKIVTVLPVRTTTKAQRTRPPTVTILKPVKQPGYAYDNEVYRGRPRVKTIVSTTQVPLKVYYSTSNEIESNSITHAPEKFHIGITNPRTKTTTKPAQYYYYDEENTRKPPAYLNIPEEYYVPAKPSNPPRQPQKLIYVTNRPYTQRPRYRFIESPKTDTFSIHIARLQKQIHQYYTTPKPKPLYQFSFESSNYRAPPPRPPLPDPHDKFRPLPKYSVQIQPAIEIIPTQPPNYYHTTTERPLPSNYYNRPSRPVSQFSFEATPNPVYQDYYDDNTNQYFTTFGQKLHPGGTTPLPPRQRKPVSLAGDTAVNYLPPRPTVNPDAEYIYPQPKQPSRPNDRDPNSYISYQLPGDDGAHFYFLTPQLAQSRDQGAGFYYSQADARRVRRNKAS